MALDALPLTPSGKTDRRALPAPEGGAADGEYVAPRTPTEETLAGIWAAVLKTGRVGVHDDFAALGGHSLLATRVVSRAREALGTELPVRAMFEAPTVAALAERVEEARRAGAASRTPPLAPVPRDGSPLPLSFAQQRLWFIDRLEPGRAAYNMPYPLRVRGALELRALERALTAVVRRHESLRTRFPVVRGEPVQHVEPPRPVRLPVVDLTRPAEAAREAELARLVAEEARRPFDLAAGPVLRTTAVRLGPDDAALLFTLHHIVSDGWSLGVLVREVSALYAGGDEARLPELPVQYADFAAWQRAWLAGDALEAQLGWWRGRLAGAPALLELPTDRPRPAVADDTGARLGFSVDPETAEGLRALSRREGASLFMTLLAAWQLLLARHAGQDDVVVGSPIAGRTRAETEGLIGFFVNMLALRADLSGDPPFAELLRAVRETTLEAYRHQDLPFERLVEELGVERSLAHTPLFQAVFSLENNERSELRLGSASLEPLGTGEAPAKFDLTLSMAEAEDGGMAARLEYAAALFDPATAARMAERFAALLRGIAADPDARLSRLPLMSAAERRRVLEEWNDTARPYPAGDRVHDLFARQAARTPDAPALAHGGDTLTYAELDRRSGRLARRLRRLGVGPETRVGVCLERTPELVVALLAVLRAGGAWVPLDPAYPRERLGWMMEDAEVSRVLTSTRLAGVLPPGTDVVALDAVRAELEAEPDGAPESGVEPENLSHVIFTSGSTGRPRGVMIRHSSTVVLLHWLRETVTDEERSSVLFSTSVNFDVSVAEVFGTLAWGGKLVMVENALELATVAEPVRPRQHGPHRRGRAAPGGRHPALGADDEPGGGGAPGRPGAGAVRPRHGGEGRQPVRPDRGHHLLDVLARGEGRRAGPGRPARGEHAGVRARRASPARPRRRGGGAVPGGRWAGTRLRPPPGADRRALPPRPVRARRDTDVPGDGPGALDRLRGAGVLRPHRLPGQGAGLPHRAGGGRGRAAVAPGRPRGGGRRARGRPGGAAAGGLRRRLGRRVRRGAAGAPPGARPGAHGPLRLRGAGSASSHPQREAGPAGAPRAGGGGGPGRRGRGAAHPHGGGAGGDLGGAAGRGAGRRAGGLLRAGRALAPGGAPGRPGARGVRRRAACSRRCSRRPRWRSWPRAWTRSAAAGRGRRARHCSPWRETARSRSPSPSSASGSCTRSRPPATSWPRRSGCAAACRRRRSAARWRPWWRGTSRCAPASPCGTGSRCRWWSPSAPSPSARRSWRTSRRRSARPPSRGTRRRRPLSPSTWRRRRCCAPRSSGWRSGSTCSS